jgi:FkbM family methyltransferase
MKITKCLLCWIYGVASYLHRRSELLIGFNSSSLNSPDVLAILDGILDPIVVDIGCNQGDFVFDIIKVRQNAIFYCFDINSDCGIALKSRFPQAKVNFFNLGLSNESGESNFVSQSPYDRKAYLSPKDKKPSSGVLVKRVKVCTLDEIVSSLGISRIDILKIDTEGHDYRVLLGAQESLKKTNVVYFEVMYRLLVEGSEPQDILELLKSNGFNFFYRLTRYLGLQPINRILPWEVATQNVIASRKKLR